MLSNLAAALFDALVLLPVAMRPRLSRVLSVLLLGQLGGTSPIPLLVAERKVWEQQTYLPEIVLNGLASGER